MKLDKNYDLPKPPKYPEVHWKSLVWHGNGVIPFGYFQDPDDKDIIHPIPRELNALEKAKLYLTEYSYREVAEWLTRETGRYISHVGLRIRIKSERRRRKIAEQARYYQEQAEKAARKAEELEKRIGGIKASEIRHPSNCSCSMCKPYSR